MSDAGEPHGTAGRPMLRVLLHSGIGEIVAVCARWFGGTKLGTGGLARAYASGVSLALETLPVLLRRERSLVEIEVSYAHVDGVRRALEELDATLIGEVYGEMVCYRTAVPVSQLDQLRTRLAGLTGGEATVRDQ
jgi:putative IMPACT (imprinted ancient) family translation regulator